MEDYLALRHRLERILRVIEVDDIDHDQAWREPWSDQYERLRNAQRRYRGAGKYEMEEE